MKSLELTELYGIEVVFDSTMHNYGSAHIEDNLIRLNPDKYSEYIVLHEIGHIFAGYMCCREHAEYVAHGVAIALARVHGIDISDSLEYIDYYAGRTLSCPVKEERRRADES